jgi:hypothetical protein
MDRVAIARERREADHVVRRIVFDSVSVMPTARSSK